MTAFQKTTVALLTVLVAVAVTFTVMWATTDDGTRTRACNAAERVYGDCR